MCGFKLASRQLLAATVFVSCWSYAYTDRHSDICGWTVTRMQRPEFVLFGDSLTQKAFDPHEGWAAALAHKYQRKARQC